MFLKIWLSVSVLIGGYLLSLILLSFSGQHMESSLNKVSGTIFPAASISQKVLTAFEKQNKFYENAIMVGDASMITTATEESERVWPLPFYGLKFLVYLRSMVRFSRYMEGMDISGLTFISPDNNQNGLTSIWADNLESAKSQNT